MSLFLDRELENFLKIFPLIPNKPSRMPDQKESEDKTLDLALGVMY